MDTKARELILPGDDEYDETIGSIYPFDWREFAWKNCGEFCFVVDSQSGLMRPASFEETDEYLYGGEYDELLDSNPDLENGFNESELVALGML